MYHNCNSKLEISPTYIWQMQIVSGRVGNLGQEKMEDLEAFSESA